MNKDIENIIRANLPEKVRNDLYEYNDERIWGSGFNEALSQIPVSLIADEVLKVVEEYNRKQIELVINAYDITLPPEFIRNLSNLSPNKENK